MSKKWYNYFVSVDTGSDAPQGDASDSDSPARSASAAQSVAEIARSVATEPQFSSPISDPTSFDEIYKAAEIPSAPQGYSIIKVRSEEHTSELQSPCNLVCRLLLEKKKK